MVICTNKLRPEALAPILAESTAGTLALHTFDVGVLDAVATDELLDHLCLGFAIAKVGKRSEGWVDCRPSLSIPSILFRVAIPLIIFTIGAHLRAGRRRV